MVTCRRLCGTMLNVLCIAMICCYHFAGFANSLVETRPYEKLKKYIRWVAGTFSPASTAQQCPVVTARQQALVCHRLEAWDRACLPEPSRQGCGSTHALYMEVWKRRWEFCCRRDEFIEPKIRNRFHICTANGGQLLEAHTFMRRTLLPRALGRHQVGLLNNGFDKRGYTFV